MSSLSRNKGQTDEAIAFALAMKPIFDQMGLSRYSAHTAAKKLNEAGIMSYSGRPWSSQTVLRVRRRIDPDYQPGPQSYRYDPSNPHREGPDSTIMDPVEPPHRYSR